MNFVKTTFPKKTPLSTILSVLLSRVTKGRFRCLTMMFAAQLCVVVPADDGRPTYSDVNRIHMDVYVRSDSQRCEDLRNYLSELRRQRRGLEIEFHDVETDRKARRRLVELGRRHDVGKLGLPATHVMNQLHVGFTNSSGGERRIRSLLSIEVFTRDGCPRCRDARLFLHGVAERWPALRFDIREIVSDERARLRLEKLSQHYQLQASSVPAFHLCRQLKVGYLGPAITGREIETIIRRAARPAHGREEFRSSRRSTASSVRTARHRTTHLSSVSRIPLAFIQKPQFTALIVAQESDSDDDNRDAADDFDAFPEFDSDEFSTPSCFATPDVTKKTSELEVPVLGRLNAETLGMPVFTFLIGLVDGFNPCAMWVLMFLLSVLVNIRERRKIIIIAGTFVFVSGLAYFAFMAAWLNVFMLVGLDRPAQLILGCLAVIIGLINVKDFFAFGKGVSFKIPEAAKPGIYARVRKIVAAKHLWAALTGAIVLALLVNTVELLCTAGLPAMYTEILTLQHYSPATNYLYLGLYVVAYMLDDSIMVAIVVATLSKKKLQEGQGRWLKLLSGIVILALGIVMILKPEWLV